MSKIDKRLLDLALLKIIMKYDGRMTLAKVFTVVEQCDRALYQHNATGLVSLLVDSSKSRKILVAAVGLAESEVDKTLYYWPCGKACHAKTDCPSIQSHAQTLDNLKQKSIIPAKILTKGARNHLSKQLNCFHY